MRTTARFLMLAFLIIAVASSATAFDGQRKGKILGFGLGYAPAGPHLVLSDKTIYRPGMSIRLIAGYAISNRSMFTFGITRQATIYSHANGKSLDGTNWMLELSMTRYLRETAHAAFWRTGLGLMDWGRWGHPYHDPLDDSRDFNVAFVGGIGYMFLKGFQVQLDLIAGPGPSEGDSKIKGLVRFELVGMIY